MAVAASALARRGRDALLATYLIEVLLILATFFGMRRAEFVWLEFFNPFTAMYALVFASAVRPATSAIAAAIHFTAARTKLAPTPRPAAALCPMARGQSSSVPIHGIDLSQFSTAQAFPKLALEPG